MMMTTTVMQVAVPLTSLKSGTKCDGGGADRSVSVDSDGDTAECLMSKMTTAMAMMLMAVAVMKMAELAMMMLCSPLNLVKK